MRTTPSSTNSWPKHYGINVCNMARSFARSPWPMAIGARDHPGEFFDYHVESDPHLAVKRGRKWILEQLLNDPPPPPPPGAELADDHAKELKAHCGTDGAASLKAGLRDLSSRLDPLGFGLETFDGVGSFRTKMSGSRERFGNSADRRIV